MNQLPDNLKKLVFENPKYSEIKSKAINSEKKETKIEKSDKVMVLKSKKDDDTDDNYDDYEDEFENEDVNSQLNVNDDEKIAEDKENIKRDVHKKEVVNYNKKIDDIDDEFFTFDEGLAVNRIIERRIESELKKKKEFAMWKSKKDLENKLTEEKIVRFFTIH